MLEVQGLKAGYGLSQVLFGKKGVYGLLLSLLQRKPKVVAIKPNAAVEVRP